VQTPPLNGQDTVTCLFGNITERGQWVNGTNGTQVVCVAPPRGTAGIVLLEVAPNGLQFTESRRQFRYFLTPVLQTPRPAIGPLTGTCIEGAASR
jgi:hypothetical protein